MRIYIYICMILCLYSFKCYGIKLKSAASVYIYMYIYLMPLSSNLMHSCIRIGIHISRTFHPFCGFHVSPLFFTPPTVSPQDPRTFHPPESSPPEMFTPSEYLSFSRRIKIMYKTHQISG